jgi:DNA primase
VCNSVTAEQAHLIQRLGKRVILCPDRDKAGKELIEQGLELDWEVSFPPWSKEIKDAADAVAKYGRLLTVSSIIKYATNNKIKAQVKSKML